MATKMQFLTRSEFDGVTTVDITDIKQDVYGVHFVSFALIPDTDNSLPSIRYINTSDSVISADYEECFLETYGANSFTTYNTTSNGEIRIAENTGDAWHESCVGSFYIYNAGATDYTFSSHQNTSVYTDGDMIGMKGGGQLKNNDSIKGFRLFDQNNASGTFTGVITVWGLSKK